MNIEIDLPSAATQVIRPLLETTMKQREAPENDRKSQLGVTLIGNCSKCNPDIDHDYCKNAFLRLATALPQKRNPETTLSDKSKDAVDHHLMTLTTDVVSAFLANNTTSTTEIPGLIKSVHHALAALGNVTEVVQEKQEPAVSVRASIKHDYLVCLEDGAKLKMLKRYLRTNFDLSPEQYRAKWNLPRDYPMVAPAYAETRRNLAVQIGLGRKRVVETAPVATQRTKTRRKLGVITESIDG